MRAGPKLQTQAAAEPSSSAAPWDRASALADRIAGGGTNPRSIVSVVGLARLWQDDPAVAMGQVQLPDIRVGVDRLIRQRLEFVPHPCRGSAAGLPATARHPPARSEPTMASACPATPR